MTTKKKIKIKVKKTKTKTTQSGNIVKVNINNRGGPSSGNNSRVGAPSGPSIIVQQPQSQPQAQPNTQLLDMLQRAYAQNLENNQNFRRLNPANLNDVNDAVAIAQNSARQIVANTPAPDQVNRPPLPPLPPLRRPEVILKPIQPGRLTGMAAVVDELRRRQEQNALLPTQPKFPIENETTQQAMFRIETGKIPTESFRPFENEEDKKLNEAQIVSNPTIDRTSSIEAQPASDAGSVIGMNAYAGSEAPSSMGPERTGPGSIASEKLKSDAKGPARMSAEQRLIQEGQKNIQEGSRRKTVPEPKTSQGMSPRKPPMKMGMDTGPLSRQPSRELGSS